MKEIEITELLIKAKEEKKKSNFREVEKICRKALEIINDLPADTPEPVHLFKAITYRYLSHALLIFGQQEESISYAEKALSNSQQVGDKKQEALAYRHLGAVYSLLSNYPKALKLLKSALSIFETINEKDELAGLLNNIGVIYRSVSDNHNALKYYKKSLVICEELDKKEETAAVMNNLGGVYFNLAEYSKAIEYCKSALTLFKKLGNKNKIAVNIGNIGLSYSRLSEYTNAEEYLQRAIHIDKETGNKLQMVYWIRGLGEVFMNKDPADLEESEKRLKKSLKLCKASGLRKEESDSHKSLAECYSKQKRWKKADKHFQKYHKIEKKINSQEVVNQLKRFAQERELFEHEKKLAIKQAASEARHQATEALLHKVLPNEIASRMLDGEEEIADHYPEVSILFADIKGFTPLVSNMPAEFVVRLLNFVFKRFDEIIKKHGCTKIKTLGDGYMAVAGAPQHFDDHAERLVRAALEIIQDIQLPEEVKEYIPDDKKLKVRIGLHLGPVVAGVIGRDRFVYDIYSDAVNITSRMESQGEEGRIHVSDEFRKHLEDRKDQKKKSDQSYHFTSRGTLDIKGKGMMKTFFIN